MQNIFSVLKTSGARTAFGLLLFAGLAYPAAIPVFNTGVDATGIVLADGTIGDPHYTMTMAPAGSETAIRILTSASGFPIGPWVGDNSLSRWIGPNTTSADGPVGDYEYRTTFDLTGLDFSTALLAGQWATDNGGLDIFLNGASTGITSASFENYSPIVINSGFVAGQNELIFRVNNAGGPTGLRVELTGTADAVSGVPEPASFVLVGLGLAAAHTVRRMKKTA